ncbi:M48 family metallopeptidase [Rhodopirellula europaea]|uniref:M48 family metallopeptidase n=1 Tax=Rhodopirellula europaea TaxID=1263866 RepID=UPI003D2D53F0|tara:strand:- start:13677 stop:14390 length:714 start_codon:yes stop_codon:yes gene_type:complete
MPQIHLGEFEADVIFKDIKNVHLSVHPPEGRVRISAPNRMDLDTIRVFTISKLGWIKSQRRKMQSQVRETPREFLDRESHYVWGSRVLLSCVEQSGRPGVKVSASRLTVFTKPNSNKIDRERLLSAWYRQQTREAAASLIANWEKVLDVSVSKIFVQKMKTRWGSCNPTRRTIRLNTELAKKPPDCLDYVVLHEMLHLLEPTHNARFKSLLTRHMPNWQTRRDALNRLPIRHEQWKQ